MDELILDLTNQRKKLKGLDQQLNGFSSFRPGEEFIKCLCWQLRGLEQGFEGQRWAHSKTLVTILKEKETVPHEIKCAIESYNLNRQFYDELESFPILYGIVGAGLFTFRIGPSKDAFPEYWKLKNEIITNILGMIQDTIPKLEELAEKEAVNEQEKYRLLEIEYKEVTKTIQALEAQIETTHKSYAEPEVLKGILRRYGLTIQHLIIDYEIPETSGVYLVWSSGELIYVGQSGNIRHRMWQHPVFDRKHHQLAIITITGKAKRLMIERILIQKLYPKHNKKFRIHPGQKEFAFGI